MDRARLDKYMRAVFNYLCSVKVSSLGYNYTFTYLLDDRDASTFQIVSSG